MILIADYWPDTSKRVPSPAAVRPKTQAPTEEGLSFRLRSSVSRFESSPCCSQRGGARRPLRLWKIPIFLLHFSASEPVHRTLFKMASCSSHSIQVFKTELLGVQNLATPASIATSEMEYGPQTRPIADARSPMLPSSWKQRRTRPPLETSRSELRPPLLRQILLDSSANVKEADSG